MLALSIVIAAVQWAILDKIWFWNIVSDMITFEVGNSLEFLDTCIYFL